MNPVHPLRPDALSQGVRQGVCDFADNRVARLLGIRYPILQGGMAWVADARLAAAVSNAGGLGILAGGSMTADLARDQVQRVRDLTDRPFGLNIMLMSPHAADLARMAAEERVPVVTTGAGQPGKYFPAWKAAGIIVIPVVPSVALARRVEQQGADAVIVEGTEAGGHIGDLTTLVLTPAVSDALSIPVIAAGGIADGRGVAAAFLLGAEGVQVGTRFLASEECPIHENYKRLVVKARDTGTVVTGRSTGHPVRSLKNRLTRRFLDLEREGVGFEALETLAVGSLRRAVQDGDLENGSFMAGQSAVLVKAVEPCRTIIESMFRDAARILDRSGAYLLGGGCRFPDMEGGRP